MKKTLVSLVVLIGFTSVLTAQTKDSVATQYSSTITAKDLKKHLSIIASDEYKGRETGRIGQKMTEKYLIDRFKEFNLLSPEGYNYKQEFEVVVEKPDAHFIIDNDTVGFLEEYYFSEKYNEDLNFEDIVFIGYGIDNENYSDYKDVDVKGKLVLLLEDEPTDKKGKYLVSKSFGESKWSYNWRAKHAAAVKHGAKGVITIVQDFDNKKELVRYIVGSTRMRLASDQIDNSPSGLKDEVPKFYVSETYGNKLLTKVNTSIKEVQTQIRKTKKSVNYNITAKVKIDFNPNGDKLVSSNVVGYIEGTDKKDEIVVITAHYDHLGENGDLIFNGADDDGSGTVALLELAEAFSKAKKEGRGPRRTIVFMAVSGEEKGLLGSSYYVSNPIFDIASTVVNLNIDMVGRTDEKHEKNQDYIYLIGSDKLSMDLHNLSENVNKTYTSLELDYEFNDENHPDQYYYRSDHYNFARNNIPVIFYFRGVHEDYHQATDTVDKIEFNNLEKVAHLVFYTAWGIANRDNRLKVDATSVFKK